MELPCCELSARVGLLDTAAKRYFSIGDTKHHFVFLDFRRLAGARFAPAAFFLAIH
jgi:hypothetical protein